MGFTNDVDELVLNRSIGYRSKLGKDRLNGELEYRQVDILPNLLHGVEPLNHRNILVTDYILQVEQIDLSLLSHRGQSLKSIHVVADVAV